VNTNSADDPRIVPCRGCGAPIIFLPTERGSLCPTDAATVAPTDKLFAWGRHISHFKTCPEANVFRKRK
jgi:hypothetical protein